jgi:hypothetical protein
MLDQVGDPPPFVRHSGEDFIHEANSSLDPRATRDTAPAT